ncbi:MAG: hypothetical protein K2M37_01755 [Muribaculaceae bacterium]|nr:hypothetical protein [Muribaculaceae bacterium]
MEKFDSLKPQDEVTVTIWGPEGSRLFQSTDFGYHSIEEAIGTALHTAALVVSPEDCTFEVTNQNTFVSHKYRLNADGNLVLII